MRSHPPARAADRVALAVGRGLLAGLAGTAAMTVSSTVEMKIDDRGASSSAGPWRPCCTSPPSWAPSR